MATKLCGSAEDLYRTAAFAASTGLKIRPARLSTAAEEEEEEEKEEEKDEEEEEEEEEEKQGKPWLSR